MSDGVSYHDTIAEGWDARYERGGFKRRALYFDSTILPHIEALGAWIDVGCGSGYFTRILARHGAVVVGIDGSPAMIDAAQSIADPHSSLTPPVYELRNAETLDYPDRMFDGVLSLSVLEYLDEPEACLAEMARITKSGGQLIISVANRASLVRRMQRILRWMIRPFGGNPFAYLESSRRGWSPAELRIAAARCGLACEFLAGFDPLLPQPLQWLIPPSMLFMVCRKQSDTVKL